MPSDVGLSPLSWLTLRPNIQLVHQPGGRCGVPDIGILGLKGAVTF